MNSRTALEVVAGVLTATLMAGSASAAPSMSQERSVLDKYCVTCHNRRAKVANLALDLADVDHVDADAATWEKVVRKLRTGVMPPAGAPRPDKATYTALLSSLSTSLDRAAAASPNPGRAALHRLNRAEYTNAIRDLLALEIDGASLLPGDDSSYGFDNNADILTVSPVLLERYLTAARKISRLAIGDPTVLATVEEYTVSPYLYQKTRMNESMPFGSRGGLSVHHRFPVDGEYVFRIVPAGSLARMQADLRVDGQRIRLFDGKAGGSMGQGGAGLETRVAVKAGTRLVTVGLVDGGARLASEAFAADPSELPIRRNGFGQSGIAQLRISGPEAASGPGETPSRKRVFQCRPASASAGQVAAAADEEACATKILGALARRAYRRPVTADDVDRLLASFREGRQENFDAGIQRALERMLVSVEFLFRIESDPPKASAGAAYRLSDVELASRMSFFLWSSIPDDELLDLAARGRLNDPAVLDGQVQRMLADPRAAALTTNFTGQWLLLRNLQGVVPDPYVFPEFSDNLRDAFQRETELFLDSQMREDRPIPELLSANYTFVNDLLARHYGLGGVIGPRFRRVTVGEGRGGLLAQASVLALTSYPTRTSPVKRGKWVLDNLLGAPPPPPPPNVEGLKDPTGEAVPPSMRERMERHRKNPVCASCHGQMDPIGFALETYDAIGRPRTTGDDERPIDASGVLPDGTKFNGPDGLRTILLDRREAFVTAVAEKLLTYALGRGLEYYDMPAIRRIVQAASAGDYRWSAVIGSIVRSTPFQMRSTQS